MWRSAGVVEERRLLPAQRDGDRVLGVGLEAVALGEHGEQPVAARRARRGAEPADAPVAAEDVDHGRVRELGDEQLGDVLQRLVVAHRALEQRAGVGEQPHARVRRLARAARRLLGAQQVLALGLLVVALGDVAGDDHEPPAGLARQRPPRRLDRDARPVRAHDVGDERGLARLDAGARVAQAGPDCTPELGRHQREHRLERVELFGGAAGQPLGRAVDEHDPLALEQRERLAELALGAHQRLVEVALGTQLLAVGDPGGDVRDGDADAEQLAAGEAHRVVADEVMPGRAVGPRAADLGIGDRAPGGDHGLEARLRERREVGDELLDAVADVIGGGDAVHLGQRVADAHEAAVDLEERDADRRLVDERVEQRARLGRAAGVLLRLAVQPRVVDRDRGARGDLLGEDEVVGAIRRPVVRGDQGHGAEHAVSRAQGDDHGRREPELADDLDLLDVRARALEELGRELRVQLGCARAQRDVGSAGRRGEVRRVPALEVARHRDLPGIDVRDRDVP
jgi:hypothetical protein